MDAHTLQVYDQNLNKLTTGQQGLASATYRRDAYNSKLLVPNMITHSVLAPVLYPPSPLPDVGAQAAQPHVVGMPAGAGSVGDHLQLHVDRLVTCAAGERVSAR